MLMQARPHIKCLGGGAKEKYPELEESLIDGSTHQRTTTSQRLPEDMIELQHEFLSYVLYKRIQHNYELRLIGTLMKPLTMNLSGNLTIDEHSNRTINILTTGHEKSHFIVVPACISNGIKLPLLVIFKFKNIPCRNFPSNVIVRAHSTGWMNETKMIWWIHNIWSNQLPLENQENNPFANDNVFIDEEIGDNHYDENELNH
ncbi:26755_t:CDS:2, partial [Racocetra persica]